jgi:hypothetical protein
MRRSVLIIVVILLAILAMVFITKPMSEERQAALVAEKRLELEQLVFAKKCAEVVAEAETFVSRHDDATDIWHLKGACEFDLWEFDEAKLSFGKVLELDPEHQAALKYLDTIENGGLMISSSEEPISQSEYESMTGLTLATGTLTLDKAVQRPSNISSYLVADYTSTKDFANTVLFLEEEFGSYEDWSVSTSESSEETVISVTDDDMSFLIFASINESNPVTVSITYQK